MPAARLGKVVVAGIALAAAVVAYLLTGPQAIGGHDEGVDLATAQALVESGDKPADQSSISATPDEISTRLPCAAGPGGKGVRPRIRSTHSHSKPSTQSCLAVIVVLTAELARRFSGRCRCRHRGGAVDGDVVGVCHACRPHCVGSALRGGAAAALLLMGTPSIAAGIAAGCLLGLALLARTRRFGGHPGKAVRWRVGARRHSLAFWARRCSRQFMGRMVVALSPARRTAGGTMSDTQTSSWFNVFSHPGFTWHVVTANVAGIPPGVSGRRRRPDLITTRCWSQARPSVSGMRRQSVAS